MNSFTKKDYFQTLGHVYTWIIKSSKPLKGSPADPHLTSSQPFWKLLIIFDSIILAPKATHHRLSANQLARQRLHELRHGNIQPLYQASQQLTPAITKALPSDLYHAAQLAADEDNYHTAYGRVTSAMPLAAMTPEIKHCCQKLYPQPTSYQSQHPYTRHHSTSPQVPLQQDVLEATLRRLKKGTAAGPFADLPDTAKAFALYHPPHSTFMPYLQRFGQVLSLILNNTIPPAIKPLLAASHFMALHKDPDDPTKL